MTTVALKGRLELTEDNKWHWKGKWAFGTSIADVPTKTTPKQQPFHYTFGEAVDPSKVAVPSLVIPPPAAAADTDTVMEDLSTPLVDESDDRSEIGSKETILEEKKSTEKVEERTTEEKDDKTNKTTTAAAAASTTTSSASDTDRQKDNKTEPKTVQDGKEMENQNDSPMATEEKEGAESTTAIDGGETTTTSPLKPLDPSLSFEAVPDGDPEFTDAASKFNSSSEQEKQKCPSSGKWDGHFTNTTAGRGRTTQRVQETSYLFLNATPGPEAHYCYEEDPNFPTENRPDLVLVRGMGENPFGTFELVGYLDMSKMELAIQRQYVVVQDEPVHTPKARKKRSPNSGASPVVTRHQTSRPYFTRKRLPSWKRKSQEESDEDEPYKRKKRPKLTVDTSSIASASDPGSTKSIDVASTTESVTGQGIAGQPINASLGKAGLSPINSGMGAASTVKVPIKRRSSQGSTNSRKRSSSHSPKSSTPSSSPKSGASTSLFKLPPTGDPKKARWRAAHFLYYQRHDPEEQEQQQQGKLASNSSATTATNAANNTVSTNPKYVIYEGEMADSKREGRGICLYSNNMLYEGEWKRNKEHGRGKIMTADRNRIIYEGEFERGRMQGQGTYYYEQAESSIFNKTTLGARYIGEFKENMRNGFGQYFLPDGSVYKGMWREGMMNGKGVFTWPDKSFYDGEWKDGKRNGQGMLKTADGFVYDGMWVNNAMEGRAHAIYPNGQKYEGLFSKGRREGRGTIVFTNGAVYEGRFRDDAIDGQGTMKIAQTMVVPNETSDSLDFMIPISFQSDMTHIHTKAGFTAIGD